MKNKYLTGLQNNINKVEHAIKNKKQQQNLPQRAGDRSMFCTSLLTIFWESNCLGSEMKISMTKVISLGRSFKRGNKTTQQELGIINLDSYFNTSYH